MEKRIDSGTGITLFQPDAAYRQKMTRLNERVTAIGSTSGRSK